MIYFNMPDYSYVTYLDSTIDGRVLRFSKRLGCGGASKSHGDKTNLQLAYLSLPVDAIICGRCLTSSLADCNLATFIDNTERKKPTLTKGIIDFRCNRSDGETAFTKPSTTPSFSLFLNPRSREPSGCSAQHLLDMPSVQNFNTLRARSYISRIPLFTRAIAVIIVLLWVVGTQSVWDLRKWGALIPSELNFATGMLFPSHSRHALTC